MSMNSVRCPLLVSISVVPMRRGSDGFSGDIHNILLRNKNGSTVRW